MRLFLFALSIVSLCAVGACHSTFRNGGSAPGRVAEAEGGEATGGGAALAYRYRQRLSEGGSIPPNALMRAKAQRDALLANQGGGPAIEAWEWLGPDDIGGRVRAILIDHSDPNIMYVGSASGGIWKSVDAGTSWFALDDFMASLAVSCMAMHPRDPSILYAGTGEGHYGALDGGSNTAAPRGAGIFKSIDQGVTWTQLPGTAGPAFYAVNELAINPSEPEHILATTSTGIWYSYDGGDTWSYAIGGGMDDLKMNPADPNHVLATSDNTVLISFGGGAYDTFCFADCVDLGPGGRVELAFAPSDPNIVYASVSHRRDRESGTFALMRSEDGGVNFGLANMSTPFLGSQGQYANTIWVDPLDPNVVVVGGLDLYRSVDGGATLTRISDWTAAPPNPPDEKGSSVHADHHVIVHHPHFDGVTNKTVYFGTDGGVYVTQDIFTVSEYSGWVALNNGLGITQFYGAALGPSGELIGGTQDNGTLRRVDGQTWVFAQGGDGGFCAIDPTDPAYQYATVQDLGVSRSTDGGSSFDYIGHMITDRPRRNAAGLLEYRANFIAPVALDPMNPERLYAGGARLWRTSRARDVIVNWEIVKPHIGPDTDPNVWISAIEVCKTDPNLIWVGHNNGRLYRSRNGAVTWTPIDTPKMPKRFVADIEIFDPNTVYISYMGYEPNNVWKSENALLPIGQVQFRPVSGTGSAALPDIPVSAIVAADCVNLYAGTDLGVFHSSDGGMTWTTGNAGPANVAVDQLILNYGTLYAVTWGRGIWSTALDLPPEPLSCRCKDRSPELVMDFAKGHVSVDTRIFNESEPNCVDFDSMGATGSISVNCLKVGGGCVAEASASLSVSGNPLSSLTIQASASGRAVSCVEEDKEGELVTISSRSWSSATYDVSLSPASCVRIRVQLSGSSGLLGNAFIIVQAFPYDPLQDIGTWTTDICCGSIFGETSAEWELGPGSDFDLVITAHHTDAPPNEAQFDWANVQVSLTVEPLP